MAGRPGAPAPTRRQIMLASESTKTLSTEEAYEGEMPNAGDRASISHETAGRVTLWQPMRDRWIPREIAATNIRENLEMGWRTECGNCGTTHGIEDDLRRGGDLNACPNAPKWAMAYCPRPDCRAKFYDPGFEQEEEARQRDPDAIDLYQRQSTPETRLRAVVDAHVLAYHPADAAGYGIDPSRRP